MFGCGMRRAAALLAAPQGAQLARAGGCCRRDKPVGEIDAPGAVQQLAHLNAPIGVAAGARPRRNVEHDAAPEPHGVVLEDGRLVAEAAEASEVEAGAPLAPRRLLIGGGDGEP